MKFLKPVGGNKVFKFRFEFGISKYILPMVEVHIVDHCNLKCSGCSHFSNISEENYVDIVKLKDDLSVLASKFKILHIALMGGEPLLHKDLKQIIVEIKQIFPEVRISVSTNGLLIPTLSTEFLNFLKDKDVKFVLSKYPVNSDIFSNILDIVGDLDLIGGIFIRNKFRKYINIEGNSDKDKNYGCCIMQHCITLLNGRLYHCPFSIYVDKFNKKFNQNIKVDSGVDIRKKSAREIYNYTKQSIDTCKYCTFDRPAMVDWTLKDAEIQDWIVE